MVGASWYLGRLALGPSGNGFEPRTSAPESDLRTLQLSGPRPTLLHGTPSSMTRTPSLQQSTINLRRGECSTFSCFTL